MSQALLKGNKRMECKAMNENKQKILEIVDRIDNGITMQRLYNLLVLFEDTFMKKGKKS